MRTHVRADGAKIVWLKKFGVELLLGSGVMWSSTQHAPNSTAQSPFKKN
jgi:hypothetical protein